MAMATLVGMLAALCMSVVGVLDRTVGLPILSWDIHQ